MTGCFLGVDADGEWGSCVECFTKLESLKLRSYRLTNLIIKSTKYNNSNHTISKKNILSIYKITK